MHCSQDSESPARKLMSLGGFSEIGWINCVSEVGLGELGRGDLGIGQNGTPKAGAGSLGDGLGDGPQVLVGKAEVEQGDRPQQKTIGEATHAKPTEGGAAA